MEILIIILLVGVNGWFAMAEIAVVSARRTRLASEADRGDAQAQQVLELLDAPNGFLSTVQVGITLISILAGVFSGATFAREFAAFLTRVSVPPSFGEPVAYFVVIGLVTFMTLLFGELVPKRIALAHPEQVAKFTVGFLQRLGTVARPAVRLLERSTDLVVAPLRLPGVSEEDISEEDIRSIVEQGSEAGILEEGEGEIIHRTFRLGDRSVASLMTPRNDVTSLRLDVEWERNIELALESKHAWFPVMGETSDEILGIVSVHDVLRIDQASGVKSEILRDRLRAPVRVPESASALRLLELFRRENGRFAVVFDEYGGFAGIATVHDVMETIVGEFGSTAEDSPAIHQRDDGTWLVDAGVDITELWRVLELPHADGLESGVFHSLGGFIMTKLGRVPKEGESVLSAGHRFEVVDMDRFRIDKVLISPAPASNENGHGDGGPNAVDDGGGI